MNELTHLHLKLLLQCIHSKWHGIHNLEGGLAYEYSVMMHFLKQTIFILMLKLNWSSFDFDKYFF